MSASQDKRKRTQQRADGTERRQVASLKAAKEQKKTRTKWIVGSILVVLLVAFIIIGNSNLFYTAQKAVKIGDKSYSVAEFNYEYMSTYQQYNQYAQYLGDVSPDAEYTQSEDFETWDDFYKDAAIKSLARKQALCDLADKEGVTLSDEDTKQVDDTLSQLADMAKEYGYGSTSAFLTANYGNGVTEKLARELMLRDALANKYQTQYQENLTYSDEELQAAYAENKNEFDNYTFSYYFVPAETETSTDADGNETSAATPESMEAAKASADQILARAGENAEDPAAGFAAAVAELGKPQDNVQTDEEGNTITDADGNPVTAQEPAEPTVNEGMQGSSITSYAMPFADWLMDAARVSGDMTVSEQEGTGYYVVLFQSRDENTYNTVNVRHILIQAEAEEDGTYTDEALAAAKTKIEEIKAEYDESAQTETAFGMLATQYSSDTGSTANGGLYENVPKGQMVEEFDSWIYDPARQPGDVDIIEDSTYHGYHLMYFVGQGDPYQKVLARNSLVSEAMTAFNESLTADMTSETLFAMRYVGTK